MADEKISVDSTDEEYEVFIKAYFGALGMEKEIPNPSKDGLYRYVVRNDSENYHLYIGKTKDIDKYNIGDNVGYGTLKLSVPAGEIFTSWSLSFCYSGDNKFLLGVLSEWSAFEYELYELFTKTTAAQE